MAISRRRNSVGKTGTMQMVDSREVQKSMDEYLERDNQHNRSERRRLGEKFYRKYWGCLESCCGHCGTVYRFARLKNESERVEYSLEDIDTFFSNTKVNHCPCCEKPIHDQMPLDAQIYFERREMVVSEMKVLKINADKPLSPPKPEIDIEE